MVVNKGSETLRAAGITSLACDFPTKAKLKELAGDMPVSHYLRAIAFAADTPQGSQVALPGEEISTSGNTTAALNKKIDSLSGQITKLHVIMSFLFGDNPTPAQYDNRQALVDDIVALTTAIDTARARVKTLGVKDQGKLTLEIV